MLEKKYKYRICTLQLNEYYRPALIKWYDEQYNKKLKLTIKN